VIGNFWRAARDPSPLTGESVGDGNLVYFWGKLFNSFLLNRIQT